MSHRAADDRPPDAEAEARGRSTARWPRRSESRAARSPPSPREPPFLDAWAELGDAGRDDIERYAYYRVGYHRGLDALRANGWRGSGYVRWSEPTNRGFLRALAGLGGMAAAIGEDDEAERCATFLAQLDPAAQGDHALTAGAVLCRWRQPADGPDKAFVEVDGVAMAERVARARSRLAAVRSCSSEATPPGSSGGRPVLDELAGRGPVGGDVRGRRRRWSSPCDLASRGHGGTASCRPRRRRRRRRRGAETDRLQPLLAWWSATSPPTSRRCGPARAVAPR